MRCRKIANARKANITVAVRISEIGPFKLKIALKSIYPSAPNQVVIFIGFSNKLIMLSFSQNTLNMVKAMCMTTETSNSLNFRLYTKYSAKGTVKVYLKKLIANIVPEKTERCFSERYIAKRKKNNEKIVCGFILSFYAYKENKCEKISQDIKKKLFEKFIRVDSNLTRTTRGTGLGLYIVKGLCENMKIDISLECDENFKLTYNYNSYIIFT